MFRDEVAYVFYSKAVYALTGLVILLVGVGAYSNVTRARAASLEYSSIRNELTAEGIDVDAALEEDLNVTETEENGTTVVEVDNPIRYAYEELTRSVRALAPGNVASNGLASVAFLGGPLLFGAWGVFLATQDFVNKTVKVKAVRNDWKVVALTKLSVGALAVIGSVGLVLLLTLLVGRPVHAYGVSLPPGSVSLAAVDTAALPGVSALAAQSGVAVVLGVLFMTVGYALGTVVRSPYVPLTLVVAYNVFIPVVGKYDPKNLASVIGHDVFAFSGVFQLVAPRPIPVPLAYGLIAAVALAAVAASLAAAHFQSKYVS
ncbi:MAG: hypothetical protein IBX62_05925 [Coriobacteriia bacterium]|nr:hypothetical protein [Coriobacteriia bacterium]